MVQPTLITYQLLIIALHLCIQHATIESVLNKDLNLHIPHQSKSLLIDFEPKEENCFTLWQSPHNSEGKTGLLL